MPSKTITPLIQDRERLRDELLSRRVITKRGCWENGRTARPNQYAHATIEGRTYLLHRLAAVAWLGFDIDSPLLIRHYECDNARCWNPDHLRTGTHAENSGDTLAHGRHRGGLNQPHHAKSVKPPRLPATQDEFLERDRHLAEITGRALSTVQLDRRRWLRQSAEELDAAFAAYLVKVARSKFKWVRKGIGIREQQLNDWRQAQGLAPFPKNT